MSDLAVPVDYDNWATERLARHCATLGPEQLALTTPGTLGTLRDTIVHLVAAKERYAASFTGRPAPEDAVREGKTTDLAHVAARAKALSSSLAAWAAGTLDLDRMIERTAANGQVQRMPLGVLIAQFLHHGNEHRAQIGSILGAHGLDIPHYSAFAMAQERGQLS